MDLEVLRRLLFVQIRQMITREDPHPYLFEPPFPSIVSSLENLRQVRLKVNLQGRHQRNHDDMTTVLALALPKVEYLYYQVGHYRSTSKNNPLLCGLPIPLPYLKKVCLNSICNRSLPHLDLSSSPSLETLTVHHFTSRPHHLLRITLPQSPLTFMSLEGFIDLDNIAHLLRSCPHLQSLRLAAERNTATPGACKPFELPNLRHLSLWDPNTRFHASFPLGCFQCPRLEFLTLNINDAWSLDSLSYPLLKTLSIGCSASVLTSLEALRAHLTSLPSVEHLALSFTGDDVQESFVDILSSPDILPHLRTLESRAPIDSVRLLLQKRDGLMFVLPGSLDPDRSYLRELPEYATRIRFVDVDIEFPTLSAFWKDWPEKEEEWW